MPDVIDSIGPVAVRRLVAFVARLIARLDFFSRRVGVVAGFLVDPILDDTLGFFLGWGLDRLVGIIPAGAATRCRN
jgi:hypothetical protein